LGLAKLGAELVVAVLMMLDACCDSPGDVGAEAIELVIAHALWSVRKISANLLDDFLYEILVVLIGHGSLFRH
jgi:hypothetical protein